MILLKMKVYQVSLLFQLSNIKKITGPKVICFQPNFIKIMRHMI